MRLSDVLALRMLVGPSILECFWKGFGRSKLDPRSSKLASNGHKVVHEMVFKPQSHETVASRCFADMMLTHVCKY